MSGRGFDFSSVASFAPAIHRKATIGSPGDPLEQEAEAVADKVMRMAGPASVGSAPAAIQRKCVTCEDEEKKPIQTKRTISAQAGAGLDTAVAVRAAARSGVPLSQDMRSYFEPRFGHDFSRVRVHTDGGAANAARAVQARAYTFGQNIVFDSGEYEPATMRGKRLLAHELAHVVQQNQAPISALQRACRSAAQCATPSSGDAAQFGATVEAESEALAIASGGVPAVPGGHASCNLPRHGDRATNFENLATNAGLGATIAPGIDGFFINACLSPNDGGSNARCSEFPGGPPAHTHPDKFCVQLHTSDDDQAKALLAKPKPLGDADLRAFLRITSTVAHESQHNRFDAKAGSVVPPAADCNLATSVLVAGGAAVETLLSEISAEIAEFDVYFRNAKANPSRSSTFAMQSEEHDIAGRPPPGDPNFKTENILGNIKDLQCACECGTVAKFVEEVFSEASASWTPEEKTEFKKAMTGFIPSFWPRVLQQK